MIDAATILAWMLKLQPEAPWRATFEHTADVIAEISKRDPIGDDPEWTAAVLTAIGFFESRFDPKAVNKNSGNTVGIWQISPHWATPEILSVPDTAAPVAVRLIRESFRVCKRRPELDRLAWYTSTPTAQEPCPSGGVATSRGRIGLAKRLYRTLVSVP